MSRDGPQSGPYQHEPDEPYHPPSDPWDGQDPWGGPTMPNAPYGGAAQPGGGWQGGVGAQETGHVPGAGYGAPASPAMGTGYGYSQQPAWPAPAPPPPRRTGWLIALVFVLVLVVAGGVTAALLVLRDRPSGGTAGPTAAPTADPTPTSAATATAEPSALPNVGLDASFARPDDCVVNVGTEDTVELEIVDCDEPGVDDDTTVYLVLTRYDGGPANQEVAEEKCGEDPGVGEYTNWYYFDSPTPALSFVLCLNETDR